MNTESRFKVTIYYGPNEAFYTRCHRPQKLVGVMNELRRLEYDVTTVEVPWINLCVFEMCGHEIFRIDIRKLGFNLPYEMDSVAQKAMAAVRDATRKFTQSGTYLDIWLQVEHLSDVASDYCRCEDLVTWNNTSHYSDITSDSFNIL